MSAPTPAAWRGVPTLALPASPARWATFLALLALQLTLIWTHAPWADEYHAALLARAFTSLPAAREAMRYEAHPPLWHLLLASVQILAPDPETSLKLAQTAVASASLALLILASPLPRAYAVLVALGYAHLIDYGTLARNYGLGILLAYAALVLRERGRGRLAWVPLALLPMVGLQFGLIAGLGALLLIRERRASWPGLALVVASGLAALGIQAAAALAAAPAPSEVGLSLVGRIAGTIVNAGATLVPVSPWGTMLDWDRSGLSANYPWLILGGLALLALAPLVPRGRDGAVAVAAFSLATIAISVVLHVLYGRHFALILALGTMAVWVEAGRDLAPRRIAWAVAALGAAFGLAGAGVLAARPFAPEPALARYLAATGRTELPIVVDTTLVGIEVMGGLGQAPLRVPGRCRQAVARWNAPEVTAEVPFGRALDLAREAARGPGRALMVLAGEAPDEARPRDGAPVRLASFDGIATSVVLYEVTPSPGPVVDYPACP